jgi:helix-turn-helix protein
LLIYHIKYIKNFSLKKTFVNCLFKQKKLNKQFLYGLITIKKFINEFMPTKNDKTKEQYILSLDYFSKLKFPNINKIEDLENLSLTKENIIICLFLIIQLITSKYLEIDSNEIKTLNNIFELMINKEFESMINFLLTIYKS